MTEKEVGVVSTFFSHVSVAAIKLSGNLKIGDEVHVKGNTTDFKTKIKSKVTFKQLHVIVKLGYYMVTKGNIKITGVRLVIFLLYRVL